MTLVGHLFLGEEGMGYEEFDFTYNFFIRVLESCDY